MSSRRLYRVATPYAVAGIEANATGYIVFAAPIFRNAWLGRPIEALLTHCQEKGWEVVSVNDDRLSRTHTVKDDAE